MAHDADAENRMDALVEVICAVLLYQEKENPGPKSTLHKTFDRVFDGVRDRLGMGTFEETPERFPQTPARPRKRGTSQFPDGCGPQPAAPKTAGEDESRISPTLRQIIGGDQEPRDRGSRDPAEPSPELPWLGFPGTEGSTERSQAESLKRTIEELRSRNEDLLRENQDLQRRIDELETREPYAADGSVGITDSAPATVTVPRPSGNAAAQVLGNQWKALDSYFRKTVRDLRHAYDSRGIQVRVRVPDLQEVPEGSAICFLDSLRYFWQALFHGVLGYQAEWCETVSNRLDPATIEKERGRKNAWEHYKDVFSRVPFYENLRESQRFRVKKEIERRQESLVRRGCMPMLIG